jgi:hypothetical protein
MSLTILLTPSLATMKLYSLVSFAALTLGLVIDKDLLQKRDIAPVGSLLYSKQVALDGNSYYVPHTPVYTVGTSELKVQSGAFGNALLFPLTVVEFSELCANSILNISSEFTEKDDVFSKSFLETLVVSSADLGSISLESASSLLIASTPVNITHGPYFGSYSNGVLQIFEAYRLYPDFY